LADNFLMTKITNGFCDGHQCQHKGRLKFIKITKDNVEFYDKHFGLKEENLM